MGLFSVDLVELATVEGVFERHGFPASRDSFVDAPTLYNILLDIFVLTRNTDATRRIDKEQAAELLLNWILNLYDVYVLNGPDILRNLYVFFLDGIRCYQNLNLNVKNFHRHRNGSIRVLSVKVGLAALCSTRLTEKYRCKFIWYCKKLKLVSKFSQILSRVRSTIHIFFVFTWTNKNIKYNFIFSVMFKQLRDHTNQISRRKLATFLHDLMQVGRKDTNSH